MNNQPTMVKQLYDAAKSGQLDRLKELLKEDKDRVNITSPFGSILHVAASRGHFDTVQYLVELGMPLNQNGGIRECAPLNYAASNGHIEIVKYLLEQGAPLDVSEPIRNPLFGAIQDGHIEIVRLLIEAGIDTRIKYSGENMTNMDAISFAREWGQLDIVELLK